jgi:hypothetical protein
MSSAGASTRAGLLAGMSGSGLTQLATLLQRRGLSTTDQGFVGLMVSNPVSSRPHEVVQCDSDRYATGWAMRLDKTALGRRANAGSQGLDRKVVPAQCQML